MDAVEFNTSWKVQCGNNFKSVALKIQQGELKCHLDDVIIYCNMFSTTERDRERKIIAKQTDILQKQRDLDGEFVCASSSKTKNALKLGLKNYYTLINTIYMAFSSQIMRNSFKIFLLLLLRKSRIYFCLHPHELMLIIQKTIKE